jgi:ADP-heptose:LPS heptosyltransferase
MNIAVRLEGGAGDCLLGNRFVAAIREKYPNAEITAWTDTEGKTFQKEILELGYKRFYKEIHVIQSKKEKEFWVLTQFGKDNYYGALENVPDDVLTEMQSYDKFYDLHIDSLKWTNYDFDWLRYFYWFPRPETPIAEGLPELPERYIVTHLVSSSSVGHRLEPWYIERLITKLAAILPVVILSTPETNHFYDFAKGNPDVIILNTEVKNLFKVIENAELMLATDSGLRYLAYGYSVPVLTFSAHSHTPHQTIPSHRIRWLMFPDQCFPLNFDSTHVIDCARRILIDKGYALLPWIQDFDNQLVRRKWTKV